jgi:hypothetical protein
MNDDKDLKKIFQDYAVEEPSINFNDVIMQRIEKQQQPILNVKLLKVLTFVFVISLLLIIIALLSKPIQLPFNFSIASGMYHQLFAFIIVFWIMMLCNILWNRKYSFSQY